MRRRRLLAVALLAGLAGVPTLLRRKRAALAVDAV